MHIVCYILNDIICLDKCTTAQHEHVCDTSPHSPFLCSVDGQNKILLSRGILSRIISFFM